MVSHSLKMFKRFDPKNDVSTSTQVKTSIQRGLKSKLFLANPRITEEQLDLLFPKKDLLIQYKVGSHLMLYAQRVIDNIDGGGSMNNSPIDVPVLFQHRDGPVLPTLKLVHQYPTLEFTRVTVDKGAIPYLLGGAHVMCPGLTNPGGELPPDGVEQDENGFDKPGLEKNSGVVIYAEGKEYAIAVGVLAMSTAEM
jgi:malignant T-cell-amplified sequence